MFIMKKENPKLKAAVRTITGKKVKQLRKQGFLPSTIYGQGMEPVSIQVIDGRGGENQRTNCPPMAADFFIHGSEAHRCRSFGCVDG